MLYPKSWVHPAACATRGPAFLAASLRPVRYPAVLANIDLFRCGHQRLYAPRVGGSLGSNQAARASIGTARPDGCGRAPVRTTTTTADLATALLRRRRGYPAVAGGHGFIQLLAAFSGPRTCHVHRVVELDQAEVALCFLARLRHAQCSTTRRRRRSSRARGLRPHSSAGHRKPRLPWCYLLGSRDACRVIA